MPNRNIQIFFPKISAVLDTIGILSIALFMMMTLPPGGMLLRLITPLLFLTRSGRFRSSGGSSRSSLGSIPGVSPTETTPGKSGSTTTCTRPGSGGNLGNSLGSLGRVIDNVDKIRAKYRCIRGTKFLNTLLHKLMLYRKACFLVHY